MCNLRELNFQHNDEIYSVKAALFGEEWKISVFCNDLHINGRDFFISNEVVLDALSTNGEDLIDVFMKQAQDDVVNN